VRGPALVNRPRLLLADEPTGSLDERSAGELAALLVDVNREEGTSLVVVTHSAALAALMGAGSSCTAGPRGMKTATLALRGLVHRWRTASRPRPAPPSPPPCSWRHSVPGTRSREPARHRPLPARPDGVRARGRGPILRTVLAEEVAARVGGEAASIVAVTGSASVRAARSACRPFKCSAWAAISGPSPRRAVTAIPGPDECS